MSTFVKYVPKHPGSNGVVLAAQVTPASRAGIEHDLARDGLRLDAKNAIDGVYVVRLAQAYQLVPHAVFRREFMRL